MRIRGLIAIGSFLALIGFGWGQSVTVPAQSNAPAQDAAPAAFKEISSLFNNYCVSCHGGAEPESGISLAFENQAALLKDGSDLFSRVEKELSARRMPPAHADKAISDADREKLINWVNENVLKVDCASTAPNPGRFVVRRLNNREYANTMRDLLYLPADWDAAADFPADDRGAGFDNNGDMLTISPVLIEHYLEAAEKSVNMALNLGKPDNTRKDNTLASRSKLNAPGAKFKEDFADRQAKVRLNIEAFAPRAYRRPVSKEEVDQLMRFAALSFTHDGESFDKATALAIRAALLSPQFLFRLEKDPDPNHRGEPYQINEHELASRLSYFLWASMPDDELFAAATEARLRNGLETQIKRMLADPKAISLTQDFLGQWLEIRSLEKTPNASPELLKAMKAETEQFFSYIMREDRSIMDFLDCDYTFLNQTLAKHYGIDGVEGDEFRKVSIDTDKRGGIFTQASFLVVTAKPLEVKGGTPTLRTSPVNRGKWILENIFDESIPPPPPNVPSLAIDEGKELKGTVRQIFEQHRADPSCAGCHARMDPYGFALENYDGFGAWRQKDNNVDVDPTGEINGVKFSSPREFRTMLASRKAEFRRALVSKLLGYALGRGIEQFDQCSIDEICAAVEKDGDRFSSVIVNLVRSYPFQHARDSASGKATASAAAGK